MITGSMVCKGNVSSNIHAKCCVDAFQSQMPTGGVGGTFDGAEQLMQQFSSFGQQQQQQQQQQSSMNLGRNSLKNITKIDMNLLI